MEVVLVPQPQTPVMCFCFTGRKVRVIDAAAIYFFPALLNKGADHTNKKVCLCLWQSRESEYIDICAVHAKEHFFPPGPSRETGCGVPARPQTLSSSVLSCNLTGERLGLVTSPSTPPSRACV